MPSAMTPIGAANWVIEIRLREDRKTAPPSTLRCESRYSLAVPQPLGVVKVGTAA